MFAERCTAPSWIKLARALAVALVAIACGSEAAPPEDPARGDNALLGDDCDPIAPARCGFPFPSDVWLRVDPHTNARSIRFGASTLPYFASEGPEAGRLPADLLAGHDGFSAGVAPAVPLPRATAAGLPTQDDIARSLTPDSPTILLDTASGELVPHFAEIDQRPREDAERALLIRPVVRLKDARRYIVAVRRVADETGAVIAPSNAFVALRDGTAHRHPSVRLRRALYADIFARLEEAGVARADLQVAWDYTTASRESTTRGLLHMRDDALARVGERGPEYTVVRVEESPDPRIWRRVYATMRAPLYMDSPAPGARFVLDERGLPKHSGWADFDVVIVIPASVKNGQPAALLQNGHGLLGTRMEGTIGYLATLADRYRYVAFATDWVGMANADKGVLVRALTGDVSAFRSFVERQHQGVVNALLAMRMMKGRFKDDPLVQVRGKSVIDPDACFYRGDSQGGILGATYMSLSTDVTRGLLGEPGMPYHLMLDRSKDFAGFSVLLNGSFPNGLDQRLVLGVVQQLWDRVEPTGWAPYITDSVHPGTPRHDVLLHVAIGDPEVPPLSAHLLARAVGAKNLGPVNREIWGVPSAAGPVSGSAMVEFDFHIPEAPKTNVPPTGRPEDNPHDKVRALTASAKQMDHFFRTGLVESFCEGKCDPE
jgi:hypothetical protein